MMLVFILVHLFAFCTAQNVPDVDICLSNASSEVYADNFELNISPFPIVLKAGETFSFHTCLDIVKDIPVGSRISVGLVRQGFFPTPIPCMPVSMLHMD